mgnify:CR=1 FL=1|jgi:hypothetical protein
MNEVKTISDVVHVEGVCPECSQETFDGICDFHGCVDPKARASSMQALGALLAQLSCAYDSLDVQVQPLLKKQEEIERVKCNALMYLGELAGFRTNQTDARNRDTAIRKHRSRIEVTDG